ncbi:MAG: CvpA family protein [Clostridiales bacterium]|jgi:uncharacterized membrane protein required for colicin V production|nr:CvpA family protein [Clostridiales bacterium]
MSENINLTSINLPSFNSLDIFVLLTFVIFLLISWHKGLLLTLYSLFSFVIAIFAANKLYGIVGAFIRGNDAIYSRITAFVSENINIGQSLETAAKSSQNNIIENLGLPEILTNLLIENNNPEIYKLFSFNAVEDYIVGMLAGVIVNIISAVSVFILVALLLSVISRMLGIISKLPVIKTFNKIGGVLLGAVLATLFIWLSFVVMLMFFFKDYAEMSILVNSSFAAKYFFNSDIFIDMILQVNKAGII